MKIKKSKLLKKLSMLAASLIANDKDIHARYVMRIHSTYDNVSGANDRVVSFVNEHRINCNNLWNQCEIKIDTDFILKVYEMAGDDMGDKFYTIRYIRHEKNIGLRQTKDLTDYITNIQI